jgi:hypothetical protein
MKSLPLPVRVAAGIAATAVDRARHLPTKLAELPVTVVSQALQLSMRVQQQVTELAIKGDDALSTLRPVEETPEWATFDEDQAEEPQSTGFGYQGRSRFEVTDDEADEDEVEPEPIDLNDVDLSAVDPAVLVAEGEVAEGEEDQFEVNPATPALLKTEDEAPHDGAVHDEAAADLAEAAAAVSDRLTLVQPDTTEDDEDESPGGLENYDELSVPQLRARMRRLTLSQLRELVRYEQAHQDRPEYVGMLSRRINTVRAQR